MQNKWVFYSLCKRLNTGNQKVFLQSFAFVSLGFLVVLNKLPLHRPLKLSKKAAI